MQSLTRRILLRGAAALPAATLVPAVALAKPDATLCDLAREASAAWEALEAAGDEVSAAEEIVFAWKRRNPKPKIRECADTDPDLRDAVLEWESAVTRWGTRKRSAELKAGLPRAKERQSAASDEFLRLAEEVASTQATTVAGLIAKARLTHTQDYDMNMSIAFDLLQMDKAVQS